MEYSFFIVFYLPLTFRENYCPFFISKSVFVVADMYLSMRKSNFMFSIEPAELIAVSEKSAFSAAETSVDRATPTG